MGENSQTPPPNPAFPSPIPQTIRTNSYSEDKERRGASLRMARFRIEESPTQTWTACMAIILHSSASGPLYPGHAVFALRSLPPSPQGHCAPVTWPPIQRGILYLKRVCFGLWFIERGIFYLERAK